MSTRNRKTKVQRLRERAAAKEAKVRAEEAALEKLKAEQTAAEDAEFVGFMREFLDATGLHFDDLDALKETLLDERNIEAVTSAVAKVKVKLEAATADVKDGEGEEVDAGFTNQGETEPEPEPEPERQWEASESPGAHAW